jgi:hypothetical protein
MLSHHENVNKTQYKITAFKHISTDIWSLRYQRLTVNYKLTETKAHDKAENPPPWRNNRTGPSVPHS